MGTNAAVIQKAYDAFGKGDIGTVLGLTAEDVDWSSPATLPQGGHFQGRDQVGKFFESIGAAWESLSVSVESLAELTGDLVAAVVLGEGTRRGGGAQSYGAVHVFTVRDGLISRFREYTDLDAPLA